MDVDTQGRVASQGRRTRRGRQRRRRAVRRGVLLAAGALIAITGGFAWEMLSAKASLERAEPLLSSARESATSAELETATRELRAAQTHVRAAVTRSSGPFTRIVGVVPVVGRTGRAVRVAAEAAALAVRAGLRASEATEAFPTGESGAPAFGFHDGRVPVESWRNAAAPIAAADALAARAVARAARAPRSLILPPVARALARLDADLATLRSATRHAASLSTLIPALAGAGAPRRYLLVFQNPAELRATGGLLGGVALLEAAEGRIELTRTQPDNDFPALDAAPIDMPAWYVQRYDRLKGLTLWSNVNMEPDFPTTAPLIAAYYTATVGRPVDGVIALDPHALAAMLEATGPVTSPSGHTFEAATVAKFVMSDTYALFEGGDSLRRKAVVLDAAAVIFDTIKTGVDPVTLASSLAEAARGKRVQVWMRDAAAQRAVAALGVDGSFKPATPGATMIGVVTQNAGANKIDFYLRRAIDLDLRLREDGSAEATLTVALTNTAPASGLPRDVIGPPTVKGREGVFQIGENVTYLNLYLPPAAAEIVWTQDGEPAGSEQNIAPHAMITSRFVEIASGATVRNRVTFRLPAGTVAADRLGLLLPRQPVVAPDTLAVRIHPPAGRTIAGRDAYTLTTSANRDILLELPLTRTVWRRIKDIVWR
ncbi:MAG TPA: DUF4012 domain-containing protein [Actinomycetota bacterium]